MTEEGNAGQKAVHFIAGTDTGVGKTRVTAALLAAAREAGLVPAGMKPVATGAEWHDGRMFSADAVTIAAASGQMYPDQDLNPFCLEQPVSPHIAAHWAKIAVDISVITSCAARLAKAHQLLLIEGTGGWYAPVSPTETMADVARALDCPVLLVVGLKLGCLNHARLTLEAIRRADCPFLGWIGSQIDAQFAARAENLAMLAQIFNAPPLALLTHAVDTAGDVRQVRGALSRLLATTVSPRPKIA